MPGLRCRLFLFLLHHRHWFSGRLRPESGREWLVDLPAVRARAGRAARMLGKVPAGVEVAPARGLDAEWMRPAGGGRGTVLYFRGGGYVLGSVPMHRGVVAKFVRGSGAAALCFEYRLAPEHPYPAALEDALAAYRWLLARGTAPREIVFAGDSAGAGLALATLLALRDAGEPLPAGAVCLSPWTDLTCSGASYRDNAARCLAPAGSWEACRTHYAAGRDLRDPYLSPLHGELAGLPPLRLYAGGHETMRDDAVAFAAKARAAGVDVGLTVGQGLCHCYPACAPLFPEATAAMAGICAFIRQRLDAGGA